MQATTRALLTFGRLSWNMDVRGLEFPDAPRRAYLSRPVLDVSVARALLCALVVIFAGCVAPAAQEPATLDAMAPASPSWRDAAASFPIPAGNHSGMIWLDFSPGSGFDLRGAWIYGIAVEMVEPGEVSFLQVSAHHVAGSAADWKVTNMGTGKQTAAIGLRGDPDAPPSALFMIETYSERPTQLRVAEWTRSPQAMPEATVPSAWTAQGEAAISFFLLRASAEGTAVSQHGVTLEHVGTDASGPLGVGSLTLRSEHPGEGARFETSMSSALAGAAGGVHEVAWRAGEVQWSARMPFAQGVAAGAISGHFVIGPHEGTSSTRSTTTGALVLPAYAFAHTSSTLDLSRFGLTQDPHRSTQGVVLLPSGHGACAALAGAACA